MVGLVAAALVCWLGTMIVCESFLFEPVRNLAMRLHAKLGYLFNCTLCMGVWVGLATAVAFPQVRPLDHGFVGWIGAALAIKAIAHLIYVGQKLSESLTSYLTKSGEYTDSINYRKAD